MIDSVNVSHLPGVSIFNFERIFNVFVSFLKFRTGKLLGVVKS